MPDSTCKEHQKRIISIEQTQHQFDIQLTKIDATVEHIKDRMDNGLSTTLASIAKSVETVLVPKIKEHSNIIERIKGSVFWISTIAVGGGLAAIAFGIVKRALNL